MPEVLQKLDKVASEGFVPDFESSVALTNGQIRKAAYDQDADFYPRDGSHELGRLEGRLAELNGVEREQVVAYGFGMQAVSDAIDVGAYYRQTNPTIVAAAGMYTQNRRYMVRELRDIRGLTVKQVDSGYQEMFIGAIERQRPNLIIAETVGNYLSMPVLDIDSLLDVTRAQKEKPVVVLDNTLPLSTGIDLAGKVNEEDNIIVVESGTKSCTRNNSALGLAWSKNPELGQRLREYRRTRGTIIEPAHAKEKLETIPTSRQDYDERNRQIFKNAAYIARVIFEANEETKSSREMAADLTISHPGLSDHDNYEYYSQQYPEGGTPIFYISTGDSSVSKEELLDFLFAYPDVSQHIAIRQSFGFDHAGVQHDEFEGSSQSIRLAIGYKTDVEALGSLLVKAIHEI